MRPHVPRRPAALNAANIGGVVAADVVLLCRRPWALWTDQKRNQSWLLLLWPQKMFWVTDANAAGVRCQETRTSRYNFFFVFGSRVLLSFVGVFVFRFFFERKILSYLHQFRLLQRIGYVNGPSEYRFKKRTEEKTTNRTRQRNAERLSMASVGMYLLYFTCLCMLEICCCNWCLRAHFVHICPARILRHRTAGKIMNSVSFGADAAPSVPTIPHCHPSNVMYCELSFSYWISNFMQMQRNEYFMRLT